MREGSRVNTVTYQTSLGMGTSQRHPIVDGIMEMELPPRWKGLTMDQYNAGYNELVDFIVTRVRLYTLDDVIFFFVFSQHL